MTSFRVDANPFLGIAIDRPAAKSAFRLGPLSFGRTPIMPHMLIDLAAGRGTLRDVVRGAGAGEPILFDYRPAAETSDSMLFASVAAYAVPGIPDLQLMPRIRFIAGHKPLAFASHPRFNERFTLLANDEAAARRVFSGAVLDAIAALPETTGWQLQAGSGWLMIVCDGTGEARRAELVHHGGGIAAALASRMAHFGRATP